MNFQRISTTRKEKGEKYVGNPTNVSVLQSALRRVSRERHRTGRSKCNHGGYGRCIGRLGHCGWWNHQRTCSRQSELIESRVTLPTRGGSDRGETSTQTVLIVPVVISMLFMAVHFAVLAHASHVAQLAAQRGAQVAATADGASEVLIDAQSRSAQTVKDLGGHLTRAPQLEYTSTLTGMTVELQIQGIVPFLPTRVLRTAWVSNERFMLEQER